MSGKVVLGVPPGRRLPLTGRSRGIRARTPVPSAEGQLAARRRGAVEDADQAHVDQVGDLIERIRGASSVTAATRVQVATTAEDAELPEEPLLIRRQEIEAPGDGLPQRALPGGTF